MIISILKPRHIILTVQISTNKIFVKTKYYFAITSLEICSSIFIPLSSLFALLSSDSWCSSENWFKVTVLFLKYWYSWWFSLIEDHAFLFGKELLFEFTISSMFWKDKLLVSEAFGLLFHKFSCTTHESSWFKSVQWKNWLSFSRSIQLNVDMDYYLMIVYIN